MITLIETNLRQRRGLFLHLLALVLLLFSSHSAMAVCSGGGGAYTITLPSTTIVPRDIAVGQPLSGWVYMPSAASYTCPIPANSSYYFRGIMASVPSIGTAGATYYDSSTGYSYNLLSTGAAGVGMAVMFKTTVSGYNCSSTNYLDLTRSGTVPGFFGPPPYGWAGAGCVNSYTSQTQYHSGQVAVRLVRIAGTPVSGSVTRAGALDQICAYYGGPASSQSVTTYQDSAPCSSVSLTSTTIQLAACTTPNVKVDLGSHNVSDADLAAIGSTTTAVPVNIKLNNCLAGMNAIQYRIEPNTTVVNQALSIVSLDSAASASGVGVQLLNSAGTAPFALSTTSFQAFAGYNTSTGGDYVIPLMARYYRTGNLSPGTATSSMVFTMLYL